MTKEITMREALDEINRLNRERDAIRAQLADAEAQAENALGIAERKHGFTEYQRGVIADLESSRRAAESAAQRMRGALERIENAGIERGQEALAYIIAEAQTALEGEDDE